MRRLIPAAVALLVIACVGLTYTPIYHRAKLKLLGGYSVDERLAHFAAEHRADWSALIPDYPPPAVALLAVKDTKRLHVETDGRRVTTLPILAASGGPGPKLQRGDRQVPEGTYAIESLHPNSRFHVALRVAYPNAADRARAEAANVDPGGDIMIHGGTSSVGCLAVGDDAAEALFTLAADVGIENVTLVIRPTVIHQPHNQ